MKILNCNKLNKNTIYIDFKNIDIKQYRIISNTINIYLKEEVFLKIIDFVLTSPFNFAIKNGFNL
jgi:hypothetical protein